MGCKSSKSKEGANDLLHFLVLPQNDTDEGKAARQKQLEATRAAYVWEYSDWLPPSVKGVPEREKKRDDSMEHLTHLFLDINGRAAQMKFMKPANLLERCFEKSEKPFDLWKDIYPAGMQQPAVSNRDWRSDKEFGFQKLNGINPHLVQRYTEDMAKFPVTDAVLAGVLPAGKTLAQLRDAGRLYFIDYGYLDGITGVATDTTWVAPIILLLVDDDKDLVPIAIQLQQQPSATNPIFTPKCDPGCWQLVKWYCQSADGAIHQNVMHLLTTHLIMETVFVSAQRNLALRHPIHQLIDAHFWFTVLINTSARTNLMVPDGQLPKLYPQGYEGMKQIVRKFNHSWDWNDYDMPGRIRRQKTDDVDALPKYYFRDDVLKAWKVVETYVTNIVNLAYRTDADVVADTELVNFAKEIQINTTWKNLPMTNGLFTTKAEITRLLVLVIFTVSCTHAAVNNGQFDIIGFVPNYPPKLKIPAPTTTTATFTDVQLADALPDYDASVVQVSFFHTVSTPTDPSRRLGQYHPGFMLELPGSQPVIRQFQRELETLSAEIKERNKTIPVPYTYLDPVQIAGGVAV